MASGTFPKPYVNNVPMEGSEKVMEYVNFDRLGIGARNSGVPKNVAEGPKRIEHVGDNAASKK